MKTNETMTPEDVARDVEKVQHGLGSVTGGPSKTTFEDGMAALSRLATAAARVPGLEAERRAILEEMATLESERDAARKERQDFGENVKARMREVMDERDAARQETEKHRKGLQDVLLECSNFREENARLTARVAELERQGAADWNACCDVLVWARAFRSDLPSPNRALVAVLERLKTAEARATASEARVKELTAVLKDAHAAMEHMGDTLNAMEAVDAEDPKDASAIAAYERVNAFMEGEPAPTTAPGLREAVGPIIEDLGHYTHALKSPRDDGTLHLRLTRGEARALLAAYDASEPAVTTAPPETAASCTCAGEGTCSWCDSKVATVTHAQLAAVVETYTKECERGATKAGLALAAQWDMLGRGAGAREVLRRVTGGQVPSKAACADCVATTKDATTWKEKAAKWDAAVGNLDLAAERLEQPTCPPHKVLVWMLGLTLPTGPGGESKCSLCKGAPDAQCPECGPAPVPVPEAWDAKAAMREAGKDLPEFAKTLDDMTSPRVRRPTPTPEVPALAQPACGDTFEPANGEPVSACDLPRGHDGGHKGWCLGSRATWEQAQPEPAAPEVEWEADWLGLRVMRSGRLMGFYKGAWHDLPEGLMNPERDWRPVVTALARALTEARRDNEAAKTILTRAARQMEQDAARKAAEDMRERAVQELVRHTSERCDCDGTEFCLRNAREAIRALPLE